MTEFYNTINLNNSQLDEAHKQVSIQAERIIDIMKQNGGKMTPFEVYERYYRLYPVVPITSIRRAMTDLTNRGLLIKTDKKKIEKYGKPNYMWQVKQLFGVQLKLI